jgi:hypothetical protein
MKKRMLQTVMVLLILYFIAGVPTAFAAEETPIPGEGTTVAKADQEKADRPTASADVAFLSQYIWRGYALSKDSLVIQPSVTAA